MKKGEANNLCTHGGDMLAYLYNEMSAVDRDSFELHLADCGTCIDDFAELSQSRYPVFEWKQLEFDPLPTPRIIIPMEEAETVSWFDKLRASFAFRPALAFGSLAAIAVVASMMAFVLMNESGKVEVAGVEPISTPILPTPTLEVSQPPQKPVVAVDEPKTVEPGNISPKVVRASTSDVKPATRTVRPKASQQAKRGEPVPTLSPVEEDEDDSLRLTDIFDEIGTS